jgi:hypothetical protein
MKPEDRYHRFVQWSDEDECHTGYCPDIFHGGCCHGDVEEEAYTELCGIVREEIAGRIAGKQVLSQAMVRATRDLDFPEVSSAAARLRLD